MPYAKVCPIRNAASLSGKVAYICSEKHPNHKDKTVEPPVFHKTPTTAAFVATTVSSVRAMNARRKRGRKVKNLADEIIIRLPDFSNVTAEERAKILGATLDEFCPDSPAVATWHIDRFNGSADLHVIAANFIDVYPPKPRRSSAFDPIALVRSTTDQITDILNERRREHHIQPIETMREVKKRRLKERGLATLAQQLAPLLPFSAADLPEKIEGLGYRVTRHNVKGNTISVCFAEDSKAHRFYIDRLMSSIGSLGAKISRVKSPEMAVSIDHDISIS
jgi:hypothetical protein